MRALSRVAAVAVAGAALYFAGIVNSIILEHPGRGGVGVVVVAIALAIGLLIVALLGTGRGDAVAPMPGRRAERRLTRRPSPNTPSG